jgi:Mn2+/Fe2+ NRAMP family transporter
VESSCAERELELGPGQRLRRGIRRVLFVLGVIGPGLITASADNDAPGIATYSMAGSHFGYSFLWILLWITLGEALVQEMAARMGAVTGKGLTDLIRERFGVRLTFFVMLGLFFANLGTTAAQFAGIAASAELFGLSRYIAVPLGAFLVGFVVLKGSYSRVEKVLLLLTLYAVAYVASAIIARPSWPLVLRSAILPTIRLETNYILAVLATIGTTITPWGAVYMQASVADKGVSAREFKYTRLDVIIGAVTGNVVSAFIVIATAATLFAHGIRVEEAAEAAMALAPVAGEFARALFAGGLLGASLLAASVLPLATAYAITEAFGWERGLDRTWGEAPMFYGIFFALIAMSVLVVLIPGMPLFAFMWLSQVANSVLLPVILVIMLRLANDRGIMGEHCNRRVGNALVVALTALVTGAVAVLLVTL